MPTVLVHQIKAGDRLSEDVPTARGNVLMQKGKALSTREVEILQAFMIKQVSVTQREGEAPDLGEDLNSIKRSEGMISQAFSQQYDKMLHQLRRVFTSAEAGVMVPLNEFRSTLEELLKYANEYNPVTFHPRKIEPEDYLLHNGIMVGLTSYSLAGWLNIAKQHHIPIAISGLLHDIGNVRVDPAILNKPSKLTQPELNEVRQHTMLGYNLLKNAAGINEGVKMTALQHHEKEDGSGYPLGVRGDKIHFYAKVVAVADIYHAMSSRRSYKGASSPYQVLEQLQSESFGKLEPIMVNTFINKVTSFHNGTIVRLSNNAVGEIVFTDAANPTRPWVSINGKIINLTMERSMHIQEVLMQK